MRTLIRALFLLHLFFPFALCQDQDGGLDPDYSGIPRLKQLGPLDSYGDYLAGRDQRPFQANLIFKTSAAAAGDQALVLVNSGLYPKITNQVQTYISDLQDEGYVVSFFTSSGGTDLDLKNFILSHATGLTGCVLIGDFPAPWYELDHWGHEEFPCDLFLMDLDGEWKDNDKDNLWDEHQAGSGDQGPEIFVGRIDASMMSGNEVTLMKNYLDKNHAYRIGESFTPDFGLTYTEDDWVNILDMRIAMKHAYKGIEEIVAPDTERSDYLYNRVPNQSYAFVQLSCHSSSAAHHFTRGGKATNSQIKAEIPYAPFFNLFCCSSLRYTSSDFLGGSYIYNSSATSLGVVGSTKSGSMLTFNPFYKPLGQGESLGESFRQWFNALAPYSESEKAWHYGMTVAGDPFLSKWKRALNLSFPGGVIETLYPPGPEVVIQLNISSGQQNLVNNSGLVHYRFDPNGFFKVAGLTHINGDLYEARLPGPKPGDQGEYYFTFAGDKGSALKYPEPLERPHFFFETGLMDPIFTDDFETDKGWTKTKDFSVTSGAWERGAPEKTDAQPGEDHSEVGDFCWVTGKAGGSISQNDLDGGPIRLISPAFDLTQGEAAFSFYVWFYHEDVGKVQPFKVHLSPDDGVTWVPVDDIFHTPLWTRKVYLVSDYITPTSKVKVRFTVRDKPDNSVVEALVDDFRIGTVNRTPSLYAETYSISVSQGAYVNFLLDAGIAYGNDPYLLLGSLSGTTPGFDLPGGVHVPLNWDGFTDSMLSCLHLPIFQNFMGNLDSSGISSALFDTTGLPLNPLLIGMITNFAYFTTWDFASNPIYLEFLQ